MEGEKVSRGGGNLGTCLAIRSHPLCMHTITTSTDTLAWRQGGTTARSEKRAIICDKCLFERMFLTGGTFSRFLEGNQKPKESSNYSLLCALNVARMGEDRGVHRVLVGKPEGKRPLGRPRRRWEDNIKWIFRKLEGVVGTGWSWLRIGTDGGHLWVR